MSVLSVSTNIAPNISFSYRYHKASDVVAVWTIGTATTNPFIVTTFDPLGTNYVFEIYNNCTGSVVSSTTSYTTHYTTASSIPVVNFYFGSTAANIKDNLCNTNDNSYILCVVVQYYNMKNDMGTVVSLVRIIIDGITYTFTPTYTSSGNVLSTLSDGSTQYGEPFYITLNSDGAYKTAVIDTIPA